MSLSDFKNKVVSNFKNLTTVKPSSDQIMFQTQYCRRA